MFLETALFAASIASLLLAATSHGSIFGRLWRALKNKLGRGCRSISSLHGRGRHQLRNDLHSLFTSDRGLRAATQQYYLPHTQRTRAITAYPHHQVSNPHRAYGTRDEYEIYVIRSRTLRA